MWKTHDGRRRALLTKAVGVNRAGRADERPGG
jgi:hypothetical protein